MEPRTPRALKRLVTRRRAFILALLCAAPAAASAALASSSSGPARPSSGVDGAIVVPQVQAKSLQGAAGGDAKGVAVTTQTAHVLDMGRLGIHPTRFRQAPLQAHAPAGAALGTFNAFMSVSADVIPENTAAAAGLLWSSFTASENINVYLNGTLAGPFAANASGRLALLLNTAAGQGYITIEGIGQTSGKRAGGVVEVLTPAPTAPGLAVAPHAIAATGAGTINLLGTRYPATTSVTLARNGVSLGTVTTTAQGFFSAAVTVPAGPDASAVYSSFTATVGSLAGQSEEERADAGTPPAGDNNLTRVLVDRPVIPTAGGASMGVSGEGFQPGETVNITGCATASLPANANGVVPFFLTSGGGTGTSQCVLTGATSARVARMTFQGDPNAVNTPSAINSPASLPAESANFVFLYNRLAPSQTGTVFMDGVSQGAGTTNASGFGSKTIPAPTTPGIHVVVFIGSSAGQVAVAPLFVKPITIPGAGTGAPTGTPAAPYPSTRVVSGLQGTITDVNLSLSGLSHTFLDDLDMLLVSPGGQNAIVMSDAGGFGPGVVFCNLTLDDEAANPIPDVNVAHMPRQLPTRELLDGRHLPGTGSCTEWKRQPVHVRRRQPEWGLEPLHRGRRRR